MFGSPQRDSWMLYMNELLALGWQGPTEGQARIIQLVSYYLLRRVGQGLYRVFVNLIQRCKVGVKAEQLREDGVLPTGILFSIHCPAFQAEISCHYIKIE